VPLNPPNRQGSRAELCQNPSMEQQLREFLAANFFLGDDPGGMPGSGSLIEAGIIDSTGVLELVGFLEDTYGIRVDDEDLVPENLDSIDNIVRFVGRKQASASPA
jgi:acyl carrier protein